jgi:hypothetical protein
MLGISCECFGDGFFVVIFQGLFREERPPVYVITKGEERLYGK